MRGGLLVGLLTLYFCSLLAAEQCILRAICNAMRPVLDLNCEYNAIVDSMLVGDFSICNHSVSCRGGSLAWHSYPLSTTYVYRVWSC